MYLHPYSIEGMKYGLYAGGSNLWGTPLVWVPTNVRAQWKWTYMVSLFPTVQCVAGKAL